MKFVEVTTINIRQHSVHLMKTHITQTFETGDALLLSSRTQDWTDISIEQFCHPPVEVSFHHNDEHAIYLALGTTPHQYLIQQRIERAKQLLKQSNDAIADIAILCGFNNHSHLSKYFRQLTGTTPSAYRQ